jgi:hypothetical protein
VSPEATSALIAAVASLLAGIVTGYFAPVLKAKRERRLEVEELHARYRDGVLRSAYDLQSRLYNILNGFLQTYHGRSDGDRRYAEESTLWLIGQYLGWVEAVRRDAQFLDTGSVRSARRLELALGQVTWAFATDRSIQDRRLIIFRVDQRAIGELMIDEEASQDGHSRCIRYIDFRHRLAEDEFSSRFDPLRANVAELAQVADVAELAQASNPARARFIQHALIDLIELLDPKLRRFPDRGMRMKFSTPDSQPDPVHGLSTVQTIRHPSRS